MTEKTTTSSTSRLEEVRGLFVLGLLAVVVSIRIQNTNLIMIIDSKSFDVTIFLDVMIFLWSFYAFFMILGQSTDMFEEKLSDSFKQISRQMLLISFLMLTILSSTFFYSIYPTRAPWVVPFLIFGIGYYIVKTCYQRISSLKENESSKRSQVKKSLINIWKKIKDTAYQYLLSVTMVCLLLVIYGNYEELVVPASIIGSIFLVLFLITKDRKNRLKA